MAGDWIKMRHDLVDDPSVLAIAMALNLDEYSVIGRLHKWWSWLDRQSETGDAVSVTEVWIDRYVSAPGFTQSLCRTGWLSGKDGEYSIPNFDRHNGRPAKRRALTALRMRKLREAESDARSDAESVTRVEKSIYREKKKKEKSTAPRLERPAGVREQVWDDFLELRRKLKVPLSATALSGIIKEANKASVSLDSALETCCTRGWRSFKAEWVLPDRATAKARQAASANALTSMSTRRQGTVFDIEGETDAVAKLR